MFLAHLVSVASAHVGDVVAGIDLQAGEQPISIEASYGLLLAQGDGFAWVCHEAVTAEGATRSPRYYRLQTPAGLAWLSVLPDTQQARDGATVWRSGDGCDWQIPAGTEGLVVRHVASRTEPDLEVLAAAGPDGLLRSTDGGLSFVPWLAAPDRQFHSVMGDAQGWWATATDSAGARLFIWRDTGQGDWVERELTRPETTAAPIDLRLLAIDGTDAWMVVDPLGADVLLALSEGGAQSRALATGTPGNITDLAVGPGPERRLWFVRDAVFLYSLTEEPGGQATLVEHPEYPPSIGIDLAQGQLWVAPQSQLTSALLSRSDDGGLTFQTVAYPDDIAGPLACPPDSDVARVCEPLWEQLLPRIRGFDDPVIDTAVEPELPEIPPHPEDPVEPQPPQKARGCGCGGRGTAASAAALGLLLALGRTSYGRRRR